MLRSQTNFINSDLYFNLCSRNIVVKGEAGVETV